MTAPKDGDPGLEEVERALSVLGGRHPERVRAEREAAEALVRRQREREAHAAAARRRSRFHLVVGGFVVGVVGLAGWQVLQFSAARRAVEGELAPLEAPYLKMGFQPLVHGTFASQRKIAFESVAGGCYALVATRDAQMRIERPTGSAGARGQAFFCTCAAEDVTVTVPEPAAAVRGLFVAGATFGGPGALPFHFDTAPPTLVAGGEACADEALEAYAHDHRYPAQSTDKAWLVAHPTLAAAGFATLTTAAPRLPFVFVEPADAGKAGGGRCFVAVSTSPTDALTLWLPPRQKPIAHEGAIAWCDTKATEYIVERESAHGSPGTIVVAAAPSRRIGGALGLREQLAAAGIADPSVWLRDEDHGVLAADTLRASVVPDPVAVSAAAIEGPQADVARVLSFSVGGTGSFAPDVVGAAAFECAPPMSDHTPDTLCVQTRGQSWRPPPTVNGVDVPSGAASGALPFWMSALQSVTDPGRARVELALIGLARRLTSRGFEPTIIEGVTEKPQSVEILGRSGEDEIVAIGLWPAPPYAQPYTDGPAWSLGDGEPREVKLAGGQRVSVVPVSGHMAAVPLDQRRTVVFRHAI